MLTGWGQGHHWGLRWRRERKLVFRDVMRQRVSSCCWHNNSVRNTGRNHKRRKVVCSGRVGKKGNGLPTAASRGMQPDSIWEFWPPVCKLTAVKATKCVAFCYSSNKWTHNKQAAWLCDNLCTTILCRMRMVTTGCIAKMLLRSPAQAGGRGSVGRVLV